MKIKNKLSLHFTLVSSTILLIVMVILYFSFYKFLQIDFFSRLHDRIDIATRLYIEADEQSRSALTSIREKYQEKIPGEVIRIYDGSNDAAFILEDKQYWSDQIINRVRLDGEIQYSDKGRYVTGKHYIDEQGGDFVILATARDPGRISQLNNFAYIMAVVFLLSVILVFSAGRWFAEKALFPINRIISQIRDINASNLDTRVNVSLENDEIGLLARNFNHLLSQLETSFELQKAFVANTSHELRTPITTIIGEAEVALNQTRSIDEYRLVIKSILTESVLLNDTISGLIDLAQVDINFSRAPLISVRLDDLIWELRDYWAGKLYNNALQVRMNDLSPEDSSLIINANKTLLYIVFNNIIGNAFKFSGNKPVECKLLTPPGFVVVQIKDTGIGIQADEKEKIFSAFYRAESASEYSGTGIGLYVTQKIMEMLKGAIDVSSLPGAGTTVTLEFPTSNVQELIKE